jgi:probable O-glycosylation ligase (exosortase A-associated)
MIAVTLAGTVGVFVYSPFLGVAVYYFFAVLRPPYLWEWALPKDVPWSYYVAIATIIAAAMKPRGVRLTPTHWAVLLFGVWIVVSYAIAMNQEAANFTFIEYLKIFVMFAASSVLINNVKQVWILMILTASALGYIAYEINYEYVVNHRLAIESTGFGGWDNNGAGLLLAMGVPLCYFAWEGTRSWWRWGYLALIPGIVHAVLMSYSRGAMVSLIAVAPLFFLRSKKRTWLAAFAVAMAFMIPVMAGKEIRARFFTIENSELDDSANSRRASWAAGWAIARDNPVFGVGLRNSNLLSRRYGADMEGRTIHSQYLQIAADNGFVGLGLYLGILGFTWSSLRRIRLWSAVATDPDCEKAAAVANGVEGALVVFCVGALFLSLEIFELQYLLVLMAAQLSGLIKQRAQEATAGYSQERSIGTQEGPLLQPAAALVHSNAPRG